MVVVAPRGSWGTWEELILGGAVLRHGTQAWDAVASELRARTLHPFSFTPEACKARYEDLQQRYAGSTAWFDELRKRRVAELRRELEKSEDSIGLVDYSPKCQCIRSLESKLKSLKAEKGEYSHVDYSSSRTDSPLALVKSEGVESSGKDTSKDGLSAGSYTQDTRTNWLPGSRILETALVAEIDTKPEISESSEQDKLLSTKKLAETSNERGGTLRKMRGKRKRKNCNREPKEGSIGESGNLGSTNVVTASLCKETSTSDCGPTIRSSSINDHNRHLHGAGSDDLMGIFNSLAANESALVFRRRLDSQKRARYKKIIRQHMDFDTIRLRIASCAIMSAKELFRDLLLLANNAMVFYSKRTREYKTALLLREIITKAYQQHCKESSARAAPPPIFPLSQMCHLHVKPRSVRPCKRQVPAKLVKAENTISWTPGTHEGCKQSSNVEKVVGGGVCRKPSNTETEDVSGAPPVWTSVSNTDSKPSLKSLVAAKKGFIQIGKLGRGKSDQRSKNLVEGRTRARKR